MGFCRERHVTLFLSPAFTVSDDIVDLRSAAEAFVRGRCRSREASRRRGLEVPREMWGAAELEATS